MSPQKNADAVVKETLRLIDLHWAELHGQFSTHPRKGTVTFVLGGTGYGKSTLTQISTGDLAKFHSKQKYRTGYVIVDSDGEGLNKGRIGDPQVASKTFLPECIPCDDDPSLVFVDCPGFDDNRGAHIDIAAMILTMKIAAEMNSVRFLFVVPASSVSYSNLNRNDFLNLCTHATSFFKNMDKVKDSIGLVITKVSNLHPSTGERIETQDVIDEAAQFLEETLDHDSITEETGQFIQHLLRDKSRWALIRCPDKKGPLSEMEHFVQVRQQIREICKDKLKSSPVTSDDFGVTLSSDSKYIIVKSLIPHMKSEVDRVVTGLLEEMKLGFVTKFQAELLGLRRGASLVTAVKNLEEICNKLKELIQDTCLDNHAKLPISNTVSIIRAWLQITLAEEKVAEMEKVEEQLKLFQHLTGESDPDSGLSVQITTSFHSLKTRLEELHKETLKFVKENNVTSLEAMIKEHVHKMVIQFEENYKSAFRAKLATGDEYGREALEELKRDIVKCGESESSNEESSRISKSNAFKMIETVKVDIESLARLDELENELELLLELLGKPQTVSVAQGERIIPEILKVLGNLRSEAQVKVRDHYVKLVHGKIQKQVSSSLESLQSSFLQTQFYAGMNAGAVAAKRQLLTDAYRKCQEIWGGFSGILDGMEKGYGIFDMELAERDTTLLGEYENILDFYDNFLDTPIPRPVQDWLSGLRSFQEKLGEMERLYGFLELAKDTNPGTISQDLVKNGDDVGAIISKFLEVTRATPDIRRIVQEKACAEDKLVIVSIATYLDNERTKFVIAADTALQVHSPCSSSIGNSPADVAQKANEGPSTLAVLNNVATFGLKLMSAFNESRANAPPDGYNRSAIDFQSLFGRGRRDDSGSDVSDNDSELENHQVSQDSEVSGSDDTAGIDTDTDSDHNVDSISILLKKNDTNVC